MSAARDDLIEVLAEYPHTITREGAVDMVDKLTAEVRAEVLNEAADAVERMKGFPTLVLPEELTAELRRMAEGSGS